MAESRIISIDYDLITYWYDDHKTNKRITVTEHVFAFIAKIIRYIPDKHFKPIRYYDIYSLKNHRYTDFFVKLHKIKEIQELKKHNTWRYNLNVSI